MRLRRLWLLGVVLALSFETQAEDAIVSDIAWLPSVQQPPSEIPLPAKPLRPLLQDDQQQPITELNAWKRERAKLQERWLTFLGPMPERPADTTFRVLKREELAFGSRELVEYEGEPGLPVQGYLLRPSGKAKRASRAGIVAMHPTTTLTIDAIAGVQGEAREHTGIELVKAGFVVFCPRCFLWQDTASLPAAVAKHKERNPQTTGMAKMLYDARRAVDILASLPDVDPKRIGAFGHSLGAKETLYLLAFDERLQAGVASEGGIALDATNWEAPWYLGPAARDPKWERNHHELLALIAPRALLIIAGEQGSGAADGRRTWPYLAAALPVYRLYGASAPLGLLNHGQGHPLPAKELAQGIAWLKCYTANSAAPSPAVK